LLKDFAHYLFLLTPVIGLIAYQMMSRSHRRRELLLKYQLDVSKIDVSKIDPTLLTLILGGGRMDPITILGLFASIIEIANFVERRFGGSATADAIERVFNERAADTSTPEAKLKSKTTPSELRTEIKQVLALWVTDKDFLDRIDRGCLPPYRAVVKDPTAPNIDVEEAYAVARKCICENIQFARRHNGGKFPNDVFKKLWEQYNCGS
jgi:hypothetical protein